MLMSFPVFSFTAKLTLLWITGALIFGGIPASLNFRKYHELAAQGVSSKGMVIALEPSNHQFVGYSYEANGRIFTAKGSAGYGNPSFGLLRVGDVVSVSYLPGNAEVSCLGNPHELLNNEEISILGSAVLFPTVALAVWSARYPSFRRWLTR